MCSSSEEDNDNADEDTYMHNLMYDSEEDELDDTETRSMNDNTVQKSNEDEVINSCCKLYDPVLRSTLISFQSRVQFSCVQF